MGGISFRASAVVLVGPPPSRALCRVERVNDGSLSGLMEEVEGLIPKEFSRCILIEMTLAYLSKELLAQIQSREIGFQSCTLICSPRTPS